MSSTQITLLKKYGLEVRGFRGQHLLVDPNIQRKIVKAVDPKPDEWILEIGPGLGALTGEILSAGARVIAVEKDGRFCEILEGEYGQDYKGKLRIENADILKTDLRKLLNANVGAALRGRPKTGRPHRGAPTDKIKIVSNLPYYITSPVLFWLISNRTLIEKATLMMQREVADRLLAQPGDKDYGRLTLALRYYAEVRRAFDVSRNCFTPRPDVDSTVVTLEFHPPSRFPKGIDENFLFRMIQIAFGARRKTLLNRLSRDPGLKRSREELVKIFAELGISETVRAEELLLKDFISLTDAVIRRKGDTEKEI